jgi:hypothetical protein
MANYPDDIRTYDNDPRAPYFNEPEYQCECGNGEEFTSDGDDEEGSVTCDVCGEVVECWDNTP